MTGATKELWFAREEYADRVSRVQKSLKDRGLDALLAFQAESVVWLTGFFTRAYGGFQLVIVPAEGAPVVVCRDVSAYYVDARCAFAGRRLWSDGEDRIARTAAAITDIVAADARLGVEMGAWHLSAARFAALSSALPRAKMIDVGHMVARMRLIKSPAEIAYQRRAAKVAERGMAAGRDTARAGISERDVAAEVCAAMIRAGSDEPGPGVLSSGERALHLHGGYGDRVLETGDTLQLETTPNVRQYHARFMRTMKIGGATDAERARAEALIAVQDRALGEVGPGVAQAVPDRIYREGIRAAGLAEPYTNKTFYSIGLILRPSGGEPLEAAPGGDWHFKPGMTFHTYLLVQGFGISETITITENGHERLTGFPRELIETDTGDGP